MSDVASPCIGLCRLDDDDVLCLGCFRTLDEIARWSAAGEAEQRAIVAVAAERRQGATAEGPASNV